MRVVCINNKPIPDSFNTDLDFLEEGKTYYDVFIDNDAFNEKNKTVSCYVIPYLGLEKGWNIRRFIPCSDIDETELVNHKEEVCTNI